MKKDRKNENNLKQDESSEINNNVAATLLLEHNSSQFAVPNIKKDAILRIEQNKDKILKNMKQKIQKQPCDKHHLQTDPRALYYQTTAERLNVKHGLSVRKYHAETGET